ncbi:MAG: hypothetical protein HRT61_00100 [Ekhidna sp.]|nr:hypothetical protein [Ekhidna sp.]
MNYKESLYRGTWFRIIGKSKAKISKYLDIDYPKGESPHGKLLKIVADDQLSIACWANHHAQFVWVLEEVPNVELRSRFYPFATWNVSVPYA